MPRDIKKTLSYDELTKILNEEAVKLSNITLTQRQLCDLELILNGGFSPLTGFMQKDDYISVLNEMRLTDGTLWPIPITLDINKKTIDLFKLKINSKIALRDKEGFLIGIMIIKNLWKADKEKEAEAYKK